MDAFTQGSGKAKAALPRIHTEQQEWAHRAGKASVPQCPGTEEAWPQASRGIMTTEWERARRPQRQASQASSQVGKKLGQESESVG